ncbi:hypothetical protein DAI43_16560, partial [Achromobacter xylosoxidans]
MTTSLRISGLVKEYRAGRPVLNGIDLQIAGQGLTAIIGPSGTGKSTLLRCINRLIEPTKGEIVLQSKDGSVLFRKFPSSNVLSSALAAK